MPRFQDESITPRNGHTLMVGIVARISGCQNQKELSLEDQEDHGKEIVAERYQGPVEYQVISTKAKGERLDRPELVELQEILRMRKLDLLIAEDLGRMVRGFEAVRLCGIAVDNETRVLSPNDGIDTVNENWEEDALTASRDHVAHNAHTSKRIKQKLMARFKRSGGPTPLESPGYIRPAVAKTYDDWQIVPELTPTIQEGLRLLRATLNCAVVAAYFNEVQFPLGRHSRRKSWDGKMVRRFFRNRLLGGFPGRGFRHTVKHNETGRRISVKSPAEPTFKEFPHLAHVRIAELDEVNSLLAVKNSGRGRKLVNGNDPRLRVPRKKTRFPGQHAVCWYCGHIAVWGANGITDSLMCSASRGWHCWDSIGFDGPLAVKRLVEAITTELYKLRAFDEQFLDLVRAAHQRGSGNLAERWHQIERREEMLAREQENLADSMAQYGPMPMIKNKLAKLKDRELQIARERCELERLGIRELVLPDSIDELRRLLESKFEELASDSAEFGELMRQLVPGFYVYLVRLCDGGHLLPRAKVRLSLSAIAPDSEHAPGLSELLTRELTLDLFERPPQRERIRADVVRLTAEGYTQPEIAKMLPERVTKTAVQRALALDRKMRALGLQNPYVIVLEPPDDYPKLRRHKNRQYRFEPREGYERPEL